MKRLSNLCIGAAVLVALSGSSLVWGKAHVPLDKVQVCTKNGHVRNVSVKQLERHLKSGGCRLPACDFAQVFVPKDDCSPVAANNGFCDGVDIPLLESAIGLTARCTANPF
jgi:hypothetical protein